MYREEPKFETHDYIIGGKLVTGRAILEQSYMELMQTGDFDAKENIKKSLIMQMAQYMLEHQLVEFTQQKMYDPSMDEQKTVIMIRAYLAPSDQVKILRLANKVV